MMLDPVEAEVEEAEVINPIWVLTHLGRMMNPTSQVQAVEDEREADDLVDFLVARGCGDDLRCFNTNGH